MFFVKKKQKLVCTITLLSLYISSRNFLGMCILSEQCVTYNYGFFSFFVSIFNVTVELNRSNLSIYGGEGVSVFSENNKSIKIEFFDMKKKYFLTFSY